MWKQWVRGSAHFKVASEGCVLINKLRRFRLYDIEISPDAVSFSVALLHKREIMKLLGKRECTVTVNKNVFGFLNFFYTRAVLVTTAIICIMAFAVLDQFAFRVKIYGLDGEEHTAVSQYITSQGVKKFTPKRVARDQKLAHHVVGKFDFIAAASTRVTGSTFVLTVVRAENTPFKIPDGDITAPADGVVADIVVFSGTPAVTVGDVVRAGDVLVAGPRAVAIISLVNGTEVICLVNNTVIKSRDVGSGTLEH